MEFLPERRSKKYEKCWEAAKSEKEAIDTVVDVRHCFVEASDTVIISIKTGSCAVYS